MKKCPDASAWDGDELRYRLTLAGECRFEDLEEVELEATVYGVSVTFIAERTDLSGGLGPEYARFLGYYCEAYPTPAESLHGVPTATADACMDEIRRVLRRYAPPAALDAYVLREAQRSGLQPALFGPSQ